MSDSNALSRHEEATSFVASVKNPKIRSALEYALSTVLMQRGMEPSVIPNSAFDLRYYLEAIKAIFENEVVVRAILDGKDRDFRWW